MNELTGLLSTMVARDASDLYLTAGAPPSIKVAGQLHPLQGPSLEGSRVSHIIFSALSEQQRYDFESLLELDVSLDFPDIGRFRLNIYRQKGYPAMVVRYIKDQIPSINELGLPEVFHDLAMEERGLILVVGTAGSGKSTSLAAMLDYRNSHQAGHILTVEDPIEFTHHHNRSLISQREVGIDTHSYDEALKHALREAPDVIMIGEIRDEDTAKQTLRYAETGHLCLSTLHANNANQAIERFLNLFPADSRSQKRRELAQHLQAIVAQRLVTTIDKQRTPAVEILINTPQISRLIEKAETDAIKEAMGSGSNSVCQTFDDAIYQLIHNKRITHKEGLRMADSRIDLGLRFQYQRKKNHQENHRQEKYWIKPGADFSRYNTLHISAKKKTSERRPEMSALLDHAIQQSVKERGYQLTNEQPDLLLKYAYGLRHQHDINLQPENDQEQPPSTETGLAVKVKEVESGDTLWYMTIARPTGQALPEQQELDIEMAHLFASLPFAGISNQ
ncbi:PilT/PilU family type 4a pilus ATPase [Maricurvus nonylphenolicus]|uniref:PilT/PilU family type 4a pilus ATPase n=1 Tax=Maricurvus nonylphenolicus TaxID=1008307 RepID=UPI0036F33261